MNVTVFYDEQQTEQSIVFDGANAVDVQANNSLKIYFQPDQGMNEYKGGVQGTLWKYYRIDLTQSS